MQLLQVGWIANSEAGSGDLRSRLGCSPGVARKAGQGDLGLGQGDLGRGGIWPLWGISWAWTG